MDPDWILTAASLLMLGLGALGALQGLLDDPPVVRGTPAALIGLLILIGIIGRQCTQALSVIGSFGGSLVLLAFFLLLLGLLITWRLKTPLVPLLTLPTTMLFLAAGMRLRQDVPTSETDLLLKVHVLLSLLAYALIALAAISALLFLLQDLRLRRRLPSRVPLPSLDLISHQLRAFNALGWVLLTIAIGTGALMARPHESGWSQQMPWIFWGMTSTWLALGLVLLASWKTWLVGRRLAQATFVVGGLALLSLMGGPHSLGGPY